MNDLFGPTINTAPLDGDKGREERGAFFTPDALALGICKTLEREGVWPGSILEPGCGGGAFLRAAEAVWPGAHTVGIDLLPACESGLVREVRKGDIFSITTPGYGLVLGNPDFAIAERVVRHCLGLLAEGGTLAFLLRAAFNGSSGRVPLFGEYPLWLYQPIAERPSFTNDGKTDPMEYALFVWRQGHKGTRGTHLSPLSWRNK